MIVEYLDEMDAKIICSWKYADEYAIYNYPTWDKIVSDNWAIADSEKRSKQFRKIVDENDYLVGYFRFIGNDEKITIGLGMNPLLCGNGKGREFMMTILNATELKDKLIELEVRTFNKRTIYCYLDVGFEIVNKINKTSIIGDDEFYIMQKNNKYKQMFVR